MTTMTKVFTVPSRTEGLNLECIVMESTAESSPKGILQIVHGMAEHKERYLPFMEYLSENGYACAVADVRGHGKSIVSQEDLGYFYGGRAEEVTEDVLILNRLLHEHYPGIPVYLLGHSLGALIVRWYLHDYSNTINGLIVSGNPGYSPAAKMGKALCGMLARIKGGKKVSSLVHNMVIGPFNKAYKNEGESSWISSDPETVKAYRDDPLCGFPLTIDGYACLMDLMIKDNDAKRWNLPSSEIPVVFLSGSEDVCMGGEVSLNDAAAIISKGGFPNTRIRIFEGMRHEILNEKGKRGVFEEILGHLDSWTK